MPTSIFSWLYDWRHLVAEPTPVEEVEQTVELGSIPAFPFFFMLAISTVIATLGLLANSAAVVIGAMIIAPLMSPIIAVSYGLVARRLPLAFRSLFTVLAGTLLTIGAAFLITEVIGWKLAGPELIARMRPSLLDMGVAIAAGAAAAYAYTRPGVSSALAGIAIAVALVPPLCAVGITLAMGEEMSIEVGLARETYTANGPFFLYLTNFLGIVFAGSLVFLGAAQNCFGNNAYFQNNRSFNHFRESALNSVDRLLRNFTSCRYSITSNINCFLFNSYAQVCQASIGIFRKD